jgi:hypothetical protein
MAYETGTATSHKDLLSKLYTFLTTNAALVAAGQNWTAHRWSTSGDYELILEGPGLAGSDEIFVGIKTYESSGDDYYNWRLQGFTGYSSGAAFDAQPGAMASYPPGLALTNSSMPYWFVADGRRFVAAALVSTVYEAAYMGFLLPYGLPSQLPYPLVVGGSITGQNGHRWSTQNVTHRQFTDPGAYTGNDNEAVIFSTLRLLHGSWLSIRNKYSGDTYTSRQKMELWPKGDDYSARARIIDLRPGVDGGYPLFPLIPVQSSPDRNVFGELTGCFAVTGFGLTAGDTITVGSDDYLVIPNVYRADVADYWALKLE